jgi:hypothetical protein
MLRRTAQAAVQAAHAPLPDDRGLIRAETLLQGDGAVRRCCRASARLMRIVPRHIAASPQSVAAADAFAAQRRRPS